MAGYKREDIEARYYRGFADGVTMYSENIINSIRQEIENGTIKIEYGYDKLFEIINHYKTKDTKES